MQEKNHINIFDFDETLFRVPGYTSSEAKGQQPYEWFDSADSLDSKFNIRAILNTTSLVSKENGYLITHRVQACRARVLEILSEAGLIFRETHFLGRGSDKATTARKIIADSSATSVTIFEDSLWEIISYTRHFLESDPSANVNFVFIDKSKVITIDWATAVALAQASEVDRLSLV